ncbi:carboxypeptidase-like regulatory domain-containing protein [Subsaximicrobium wynnwilliamsii]|jgi:hypothetical protein|uniref:Carboxypeptidase-like regulatory domain-containing protein n=1 Tax=Subsaximicrobium wynnwilliamsii TaxID=291179 RepID=A0A5C6ZAA2_9FLAO|nr:carboxypeptidase-like regulatory domain-containing protein [Subsaximicrobium wynnwilliamsii]TXD86505.1 carboxypeptidase-like regulatory domain-containing protein [Subsaximicrobium wynnwilliamsii]TXE00107.1 carboxypeptidase-like regulatory domain-containing protein [Subsaximicrobium wynnwilliamsii]
MRYFFLKILLLLCSYSFSQSKIVGNLKSEKKQSISGASITITNLEDADNILNYDISDNEGNFSIILNNKSEKLKLNVKSMGYKSVVRIIDNKSQILDFILEEAVTELKEVVLKSNPIIRRGDTLNYSVNSFVQEQDRTIADVLKRMPGIEVLSDGKILYQGKPINKYYIEGLDLLEGKYNLANENLPHRAVSKVQILENHQPIRILDSLVYSDKAALNIKLKNEYTLTGQAELGSGLTPLLWDANITPLLFTKKQQMLVSYQTNNTGNDAASQLKTLTFEDLLEQFENNTGKQDWLGIQKLSTPNFSEKRWLDNNIHLLTGNYLHKLKRDYEVRLNVSYLNDYQQQNGFTNTSFYTPTDTISLMENKYNQLYLNSLETNLTIQKNTKENYLKNSLQFQGFWDGQIGNIQINGTPLSQNLSNRYFKFSNKFKTIFFLGKQLASLNSYIRLNQTPQTLKVNPGQFEDLLNNGNPYGEVFQEVDLRSFYTNNSLGFTKGWKQFSFSPNVGFQFENQNLESQISTSVNKMLLNAFHNDLDWRRTKLYFDLKTQYKKEKWRVELTTPVNFHRYQIEDEPLQESEELSRLTFEPRLSIIYDANAFWKFNTSASVSNQFGTINQLHYAYILRNYRNIQRINTALPQTFNQTLTAGISYRNPLKSFFWNILYTRTQSENNLLYQTQIMENGVTELQAIEQDNDRTSQNLSTRLSKYFSKLNTNVALNANFGLQDFQQILNEETSDIETQNFGIGGKIETDITDWFNTEYQAKWAFSNNRIQEQSNTTITRQNHLLNLNFYPNENQYFTIKTEYIKNNLFSENTENFFADLVYRYTWKEKNIDFELQASNLFNTKNYRTININEFSYVETNFRLRPRQFLFKVRFSL